MKTLPYNKADYTAPLYETFPDFLDGIAERFADRPALSWFTPRREEQTLTYAQLTQKIAALRNALLHKQLEPGTHIAVLGENSADWIIAFLAIVSCGHVAVCIDTEQSDENIRDMITRSDSRIVFLSESFLAICEPLLAHEDVSEFILMGRVREQVSHPSVEDLCALGLELEEPASVLVSPDQTADIVFTSGTTSTSKMVMLSQNAIMRNTYDSVAYVHFFDRVFCSLPFYHTYGLNCAVFNSFLRGCHLYINGNLKTMMRDLQLAKPDTMFAVPLMVEAIHNQIWVSAEKSGKADSLRKLIRIARTCQKLHLPVRFKTFQMLREKICDSLRLIICGGAHLSQSITEEFDLLDIQILQGYGITECSPLIAVNCNYANKIGSIGLPLASMEVKIEEEEIWVRGPSVMQGYYKNPEETALALTEDGWFKTGDLGYLDKDGYLFFSGRKKNLIVFKNGKKVSPEQLEDRIAAIPMVKEVVVSGSTNGNYADDVKLTASIFPDAERTQGLSSYEILEHLQSKVDQINATLPSYQQIQLVNIREKEFSKTGTKKIKRHSN